jgi:hypothetical protein
VLFGALAANLLPLDDPSKISLLARRQGPSALHLFGTDHLGPRRAVARGVRQPGVARGRLDLGSSSPCLPAVPWVCWQDISAASSKA